jgi:hypothetical protein
VRFIFVARESNFNVLAETLKVFTEEHFRKLHDVGVGRKWKDRHQALRFG